ncbi:hypothetical protein [Listeria booriae]|uniref:hypothetical protein n=1 Tax=Listeria booriae TaxID=1552123 RepID=UPI0016251A04|nr:hypothetical protein [Listeria booriae]MBC1358328.1 hypothetical protein [Listeria booriae]
MLLIKNRIPLKYIEDAVELSDLVFNLEVFHLDNYPADITEPSFYQNWLLFLYGDKLITLDIAKTINKSANTGL